MKKNTYLQHQKQYRLSRQEVLADVAGALPKCFDKTLFRCTRDYYRNMPV